MLLVLFYPKLTFVKFHRSGIIVTGDKMNKFKAAFLRFMSGRYGNDSLNNMLFGISIGIYLINAFFVRNFFVGFVSQLLLLVVLFRMFSRNWYKRQAENNKYMALSRPIRLRVSCFVKQLKDKDRRYFLCPNCQQIVRVPRGHGKVEINCPKCHHSFERKT